MVVVAGVVRIRRGSSCWRWDIGEGEQGGVRVGQRDYGRVVSGGVIL